MSYIYESEGHRFEIVCNAENSYSLVIDGQETGHYPSPKDAMDDCHFGHVATVVVAEPPYQVSTKGMEFPVDWKGTSHG